MTYPTILNANQSLTYIRNVFVIVFSMMLLSCTPAPKLTKTPTVYLQQDYPASVIPKQLQTTEPKLYFMTDRMIADEWTNQEPYTTKRLPSMAFGEVTVSFGKNGNWQELVKSSEAKERTRDIGLKITNVDELIRFPSTPLLFPLSNTSAEAQNDPAFRTYKKRQIEFKSTLAGLLKQSNKRDVVLFVHGFNNEFDDSVYAMADLWHFSGRIGVPLSSHGLRVQGGFLGTLKIVKVVNIQCFISKRHCV